MDWSLLYDIVAVVLFIWMIAASWRKGFVHSLISTIGYIISYIIAYFGSGVSAQFIYQNFAKSPVESFVRSQMNGWLSSGSGVITYESIPQTVRDLLSTFGLNEESINGFLQGNSEDMVTNIANGIAEPMVTTIITIVLFFIIFFLCLILVRVIASATNIVNHVPLVGTANHILGGAMGIIKWCIVMILLSMAVQLVISFTNNELEFMNRQVVEDAFLFRYILKWNPLY